MSPEVQLSLSEAVLFGVERQWRLARVELANWGTFCGYHRLEVNRRGLLITGPSGSGKSTLLDAITTVLTPPQSLRLNAAARSDSGGKSDRTLISYIRGAWRRETDENGEVASTYLRPNTATWSGIMLQYRCGEFEELESGSRRSTADEPINLLALFSLKAGSNSRDGLSLLYAVVRGDHALPEFQPYVVNGIDQRKFRQEFPDSKSARNHAQFAAHFRQLMGISSPKTLELLHKTQAAKNFGSLDELFRNFMLDEPETFELAKAAVEQFTELDTAHKNVVDQREQMQTLEPLLSIDEQVKSLRAEQEENQRLQAALDPCTDQLVLELQTKRLEKLNRERDNLEEALLRAESERNLAQTEHSQAQSVVDRQGGIAIDDAEKEVAVQTRQLAETERNRAGLLADIASTGIRELPTTKADWNTFKREIENRAAEASRKEIEQRDENRRAQGLPVFLKDRIDEIEQELRHLRSRRSNIPRDYDGLRVRIARHLGVTADTLPFMGELLSVREEFSHWQGALERLIGQRSLTLLVPANLAKIVAGFVDEQHLGLRFEFVSVPREVEVPGNTLKARSAVRRLSVSIPKAYPEFGHWVNKELREHFDYECVDSVSELDSPKYSHAITINGQIKRGRRFIKDDRHAIGDQRRWLMGADNEQKIEEFEKEKIELERQLVEADRLALQIERTQKETENLNHAVKSLRERPWENFDLVGVQRELEEAKQQVVRLRKGNKNLSEAIAQRDKAKKRLDAAQKDLEEKTVALREAENQKKSVEQSIEEMMEKLTEYATLEGRQLDRLRLEFKQANSHFDASPEAVYRTSNMVRTRLSRTFQSLADKINRRENQAQLIMQTYRSQWPSPAADLSQDFKDIDGYLGIYRQIKATGLPNHESQFLKILREFSQDQITLLASTIRNAPSEIQAKLDPVNQSLSLSEYADGTHLRIEMGNSRGRMATEFLTELNAISSGSFNTDNIEEAEPRFERAAAIIRRLGSGEPIDVRWRRQCLDTRLHVKFIANEIDTSDEVVSVYESDTGLSGGQKQKLVIFCLAAALRYQLAEEGRELPRYGTVILDEAFDKADFHFASSALDIFEAFGFHMVLATPLRHLQTIEKHVGGIVAVNCFEGQRSELYPIPFEEVSADED